MCSTPRISLLRMEVAGQRHHALGDVLGEIADALEVVGDAQRADDLAQVDRHRLAAGDGEHGLVLDLTLQRVDLGVGADHLLGQLGVAPGERVDRSAICFSARPPISATMRVSSCRSTSKALAVCSVMAIASSSLPDPAGSAIIRSGP